MHSYCPVSLHSCCVKGMYPAPHIHEHMATAYWHEQPGAHCEQWHGHHKAHWRVQCAVLSTPRTVCRCTCVHTSHLWLKSRPVCHSMSSMHAHLCVVSWVVSPHPSFYFLVLFLFQLYLMSNSAPDEISIEDPLCNSSLGSMVTLDYVTPLTCCQSVQSHIDLHAPAWLKSRSTLSACRPKTFTPLSHRAMSCTLQNLTPHEHSFVAFSWINLPAIWTTLRRSTATERRPDGITTSHRLWAQPDCWRPGLPTHLQRRWFHWTWGFSCQTLVLPPVDHSINLWHSGKHRDATWSGLWWRTTSNSAGVTTVLTGVRSKCRTIASLSLWTRKPWCAVHLKIR